MSHVIREKRKLLARIKRVRGQVEAMERAIEEEAECEQVLHLVAGIRGSMASLMAELMEDHVRAHFGGQSTEPPGSEAAERLIEIFNSYLK